MRASLASREVLLDLLKRTGTTPEGLGGASHSLSIGRVAKQASSRGSVLFFRAVKGADLTRANLSYANLQGVDLSGATLTKAALIGANLQGADLSGATLSGAILDEADVRAAKVTEEQLQTVVSEKNVKREP